MTLTQHTVLTGLAAAALSSRMGGSDLLAFAVGSILIDVDHYFLYIIRTRNLSIRGMFRYFDELQPIQKDVPYLGLCLFHTVDFLTVVGLMSPHYPILQPFLLGCLFHFTIDLTDLYRKQVLFIRPYFLLEHVIRRRSKGYPWY